MFSPLLQDLGLIYIKDLRPPVFSRPNIPELLEFLPRDPVGIILEYCKPLITIHDLEDYYGVGIEMIDASMIACSWRKTQLGSPFLRINNHITIDFNWGYKGLSITYNNQSSTYETATGVVSFQILKNEIVVRTEDYRFVFDPRIHIVQAIKI